MCEKKVAIVHDWLVDYRGGEKVLEAFIELYPNAPIYTLFYDPRKMPEFIRKQNIIRPPFLNLFKRIRKILLPFLPAQIEACDLRGYDLVISTSSCVAKGVVLDPYTKHLSYIHSPMRYIWDQRQNYFMTLDKIPVISFFSRLILSYLRVWDFASSQRIDCIVANSSFVAQRIKKYYRRESVVIHPPVDIDKFSTSMPKKNKKDFYLAVGAFVPYKRFDLILSAFNKLDKNLVIAGDGPLVDQLKKQANKNISVVVHPSDQTLKSLFAEAKGFIFPMVEDFGIVAIEALASGLPLIALQKGGAIDFVQEGINGIFFEDQTEESLCAAIEKFEKINFDAEEVKRSSEKFAKKEFQKKIKIQIEKLLAEEV